MPRKYLPVTPEAGAHGALIRKTRISRGLTQLELAKIFGVWRETITRLENGHFNITEKSNSRRNRLLNERMRIWAEMNKHGKKKKFVTSRYRPSKIKVDPSTLLPRPKTWRTYGKDLK